MNKTVLSALAIILILGYFLWNNGNKQSINTIEEPTASTDFEAYAQQTKSFGNVEVTIEPVQFEPDSPIEIKLTMNTHSVELDYNILEIVTLSDTVGNSYKPINWDGGKGGHHLTGIVRFSSLKSDTSILTFSLNEIDNQTKSFTWELPKPQAPSPDNQSYTNVSSSQLAQRLKDKDFTLVDVHIPEQQHIPDTDLFIPFNNTKQILNALPNKDQKIVLYCRSGSMSQ